MQISVLCADFIFICVLTKIQGENMKTYFLVSRMSPKNVNGRLNDPFTEAPMNFINQQLSNFKSIR